MKKIIILVISIFCSYANSAAQDDSLFTLVREVEGDILDFTVDNLDNIYILNSKNQVKKLDVRGDSIAVYNDVRKFGKATFIDVSNPLKILLYYRDYATVVVLDRFLNAVNVIDLRKQDIFQARAIGQSYDNKLWVFDEQSNTLKKIGEDGKLLLETPDFRLLLGHSVSPVKIFDENKYVYLYDPAKGIYVFDYFGTLKNNIMIQQWDNLRVAGPFIFGSNAGRLYRYEIKSTRYDDWKIPKLIENATYFNFSTTRLYAFTENRIRIYSIR